MVAEQVTGSLKEVEGKMEQEYGRWRNRLSNVSDSVRQYSERAGRAAEGAWNDTLETIRANPGRSIGIALAAGIVLGLAIGRARRD